MPQCYICDQYQDECIIDPMTKKLRHCGTCEVVIQDLLDSYEHPDTEYDDLAYGEVPLIPKEINVDIRHIEAETSLYGGIHISARNTVERDFEYND